MRKNLSGLVMGLGTLAVVLAIYFYTQLRLAREQVASAEKNWSEAKAATQQLHTRYRALEAEYARLASDRRSNALSTHAANTPADSNSGDRVPKGGESRPADKPPIVVAARDPLSRPVLPRRRQQIEMIRHLNLSEGQAAKLLEIMTRDENSFIEALASQADQQKLDALRAEADQHIRDEIGDTKYNEYQDYRKYAPEHEQINRLNRRLADTNATTLAPEQENVLLDVMKQERNKVAAPSLSQFASRGEFEAAFDQWRSGYVDRVQARASTILAPDQFSTFKSVQLTPFRGRPPADLRARTSQP